MQGKDLIGLGVAGVVALTYYLALWLANIFNLALAWLVPLSYFVIGLFVIGAAAYKKKVNYPILIVGIAFMALGLATLSGIFWRAFLAYFGL